VGKWQRHLQLEKHFHVAYWEQRGCGVAPRQEADSVSLPQQVADLRTVLQWFHTETKQTVTLIGISIGATIALRAVEHDAGLAKAVVAISPDVKTSESDTAADAFLRDQSLRAGSGRLGRRVAKLEKPPYLDLSPFQRRTSLLIDLGTIERGKTFTALMRETVFSMLRTYGVAGTVKALRNLNLVQRRLLPELVSLDLLAAPPRVGIPVHYLFGQQDALTPVAAVKQLPAAIGGPGSTIALVPDAGHMVHFDQPELVRSIAVMS
jgi:pimeloyl-ACP methyl ester carboxylesterase